MFNCWKSDEPSDFHNYLRMTETVYKKLLSLVSPFIKHNLCLATYVFNNIIYKIELGTEQLCPHTRSVLS